MIFSNHLFSGVYFGKDVLFFLLLMKISALFQDLALNSEMFHVAALSEDDSDAAPLLPEASPRTQRKFDTVRQEDVVAFDSVTKPTVSFIHVM